MTSGWRPTLEDPLLLLAMDHRDSFAKLFGDDPDPTGAELDRLERVKGAVYEGAVRSLGEIPRGRAGVLVDEQFGSGVIARAPGDGLVLAVPIEASGRDWFEPVWGDDWLAHVERIAPDFAKVLVRDNPDLDADERAGQSARLAEVSRGLRDIGTPLIFELLVPATDEQKASVGGDADRYDADLRPRLTVDVVGDAYAHGIRPQLWKVEGLETEADARTVVDAVRAGDPDADLIVLGRDAPHDRLTHWLEVAKAVPGFVGFAIGRSIWEDLVRGLPAHPDDDALSRVSDRVRDRYLDYVRTWTA